MRMSIAFLTTALTATAIASPWNFEDPPPTAHLYTFDALRERLTDKNLRIVDVRAKDAYEKGHIPGAVWADEPAAQKRASRTEGLTDRSAWSAWVEPLGITPDTEVVVYGDNRQLSAARVWWLLSYLGAKNVALLDGNFSLWEKEGHPVDAKPAGVEPKAFAVSFQSERHATRGEMLDLLKDSRSQVLDARSHDEYTGAEAKSKRGGHIPKACHLEWTNTVDEDGRFLKPDALRAKVAKSGIKPGAPVVSHCQGGGRASVNAFVLERLGYKTRNYYLGWSDWGNVEDTPVESETKGGK